MFLPNTRHIAIDDDGWELHGRALHTITWDNEHRDVLSVQFSMERPDLPVIPADDAATIAALTAFFAPAVREAGGAILEVAAVSICGVPAVRTLFRFPLRPAPGTVLVGSITVPFAEWGYILRVQCPSPGAHSARHQALFAQRMAEPGVVIDPATAAPTDWLVAADGHALGASYADDVRFDAAFPNDALSRARATLDHLAATTRFEDRVLESPPFTGAISA